MSNNLQEEVQRLSNLSKVTNTDKNTEKWLRHITRYIKENNIQKNLDQIDNRDELDEFLSLFIAWLKRKDGTPFKVESVHNCYAALARYLREHSAIGSGVRLWDKYYFPKALKCLDGKMRLLQMDGYGDTNSSDALTSDEITACLNHNYLSVTNNEGLTRRIFFWLSLLCGLRGGDTSNLQYRDVESRADGGLQLRFRKEKNNQGGVFQRRRYGHTATRTVPIPPDNNENQFTPIKDIILYLSKRPAKCQDFDPLFLECVRKASGISFCCINLIFNVKFFYTILCTYICIRYRKWNLVQTFAYGCKQT